MFTYPYLYMHGVTGGSAELFLLTFILKSKFSNQLFLCSLVQSIYSDWSAIFFSWSLFFFLWPFLTSLWIVIIIMLNIKSGKRQVRA